MGFYGRRSEIRDKAEKHKNSQAKQDFMAEDWKSKTKKYSNSHPE
jgi:hypothetical protein